MDLLEYQGKELFERHGIKLIPRQVAQSAAEAREVAGRLGPVAVKVQVQAGGRGKGGGIVLAKTPAEAERAARKMFEDGFNGMAVTRVLLERMVDIERELYMAITLDRAEQRYVAMTSSEGGIDIEEVAATRPEAIRRASIDPLLGLKPFHVRIIGNGAGLVMSTLDLVQQAGGAAANFLDVGGGAGADVMAASLEVILSDPAVRSVLVNIFGGITRCDLVARGILEALERVEATVPIVVRLDGTNAEEGRRILADAGHPRIVPAATMLEAAERAAELAKSEG